MILCDLRQIDRRCDEKCCQRTHPFTAVNTGLVDRTAAEQLIQPLEVLDVGSKVIQKHNIKQNTQHLRQRRIALVPGFFRMLETLAANADRQKSLCSQPYDRAERLLKAHAAIPEKCRSVRCLKPYRAEDQRNSSRRANMLDSNLCRKGHPPASVPDRVAFLTLNEEIAVPCVVVSRRNGHSEEMAALDILLDSAAIYVLAEKVTQGSRVQRSEER